LAGGAVGEQGGGVDRGGHLREARLCELEVGQVLAEHRAARGALQGLLHRAPRKAERCGGHRGAEHVQRAHRYFEAFASGADAMCERHAASG
jgi:hypothetical protein